MKKLIIISTIIAMSLSFMYAAISTAEEKTNESIFKYKKELSITDKQEKNLLNILSKLQDYMTKKQKELNTLRTELNKMISEKADLGRIKARLQTIARIQADATYEDIASIRAIEKELTAEQMAKWRAMQAEFRKKLQQKQAVAPEQKGVAK